MPDTTGMLDQAVSVFYGMQGITIVLAGLVLGFVLVWRVRHMIEQTFDAVDYPEPRTVHPRPTPPKPIFSLDTSGLIESPEPTRKKLPKKCPSCGASTIETFHGKDDREACIYCGTVLSE